MSGNKQTDIRKWFMKSHDKGNGKESKLANPAPTNKSQPEEPAHASQESSDRRKTSKYLVTDKQKPKDEKETQELPTKRKAQKHNDESVKPPPVKKLHIVDDDDDDDDFILSSSRKNSVDVTSRKKLKSGSGRGIAQKPVDIEEGDEDDDKDIDTHLKSGGIGSSAEPASGRGRGSGWGSFINFGERKDPPHKGEKVVPEGAPNCLAGLTFVISGTLDSLEREEAEDLIKRHGGRVTGSISKKTNYLLCDEDIGGRKSSKAKELGTAFLTEDGLFDMIRASNPAKAPVQEGSKRPVVDKVAPLPKKSPQKIEAKKDSIGNSLAAAVSGKGLISGLSPAKHKTQTVAMNALTWTEKYSPKVLKDIIGNESLVDRLRKWLANWNAQFLDTGNKKKSKRHQSKKEEEKGKKQINSAAKKAVLISGTPGIGKTTSAKLVSQMLGFQAIEVNASDSRGKADTRIEKGIAGSNANSIKELVSNEALSVNMDRSKHPKTVLIMDEVDGMSAGDRGGIADLIASIKISKIPIICICNDRYSQKLKSLVNYCLLLEFKKPEESQMMAKRLMEVANAEGLQVNQIVLKELAERVNGDMRMALNQLQYMSLSMSVIKYDDIRQCLHSGAKDQDISPFTAVDILFRSNGKLRMDEQIDLSMSDPDLVPLLIQENYINCRPSSVGKDDNGIKCMSLIARAAESIGDGDIINVQIRRYRQWQLSQIGSLASCIIPAALLHEQMETRKQRKNNFIRFGGWLGKNSTTGKNLRLLEDFHVRLLASRECSLGRETLRVEYLTLLTLVLKRLTEPLQELPKDGAAQKFVEFMNMYSISWEDFDTIVELSKFQGHPNPLDGKQRAVKATLTKAYKEGRKTRMVRAADLVKLPGVKKAPKKRIAAILEPSDDGFVDGGGSTLAEGEEDNSSDMDELGPANVEKLQMELQSLNSKGMQVEFDMKGTGKSKKTPVGKGNGGSGPSEKKGAWGSVAGAKRRR
ncbi:replication factor C subunit 1-like isoform X2 [Quercus lobata]|uniref:replication factor C subunit 1-like isoform X2 n=1 Tax=Quercus lobata TaxID=97700 RepID=UPI001243FF9D|nr:replication factor C subunit 1-like isoform X2 [Quercus lobata]